METRPETTLPRIDLTAVCLTADWHLATVESRLVAAGLSMSDAAAFAAFEFADHAETRDCDPEECVTDEQWERIASVDGAHLICATREDARVAMEVMR